MRGIAPLPDDLVVRVRAGRREVPADADGEPFGGDGHGDRSS